MPHQPLVAVVGQLVGMDAEQRCNNHCFDCLRQKRWRPVAQNLGQQVRKVLVGRVEKVMSVRGYPFMPSPTFAHSSRLRVETLIRSGSSPQPSKSSYLERHPGPRSSLGTCLLGKIFWKSSSYMRVAKARMSCKDDVVLAVVLEVACDR